MSTEVHEPSAKYLVPANGQQIEIGLVPNGWEFRALSQCGELKNGINKAAEDFGHGHPFVNLMDVFGKPKLTTQLDGLGLLKTTADERKNYDLRAGDVLFVRSSVKPSGVGLTTLVSADVPNAVYSGFLIRFRVNGALDPAFLEHCFYSSCFRERLIASSTVSANTNINQEALKELKLAFPTCLGEQRAIATTLSDVDALIAGLERLIAKKRDIKQAAMQQLLTGQTRLPGFSGGREIRTLGELCSMKSGLSITAEGIDDHSPYRCFGGNGIRGYTQVFTHDGSYALIGRQGALCGNVLSVRGKFFASEHALVVTPRPSVSIEWLTFVLGCMNLNQYSESSAQPGLSAIKLLLLEVSTPSQLTEQTAIATVLSDMDTELSALDARLTKTRAIKQGMMQELLTGRTRLI